MKYNLKFLPTAFKEWKKLDNSTQIQFKKKINNILTKPHILKNQLRGFENHYKIKLRSSGYRLVYEVMDKEVYILVIAIGKRNKNIVYKNAKKRSKH